MQCAVRAGSERRFSQDGESSRWSSRLALSRSAVGRSRHLKGDDYTKNIAQPVIANPPKPPANHLAPTRPAAFSLCWRQRRQVVSA